MHKAYVGSRTKMVNVIFFLKAVLRNGCGEETGNIFSKIQFHPMALERGLDVLSRVTTQPSIFAAVHIMVYVTLRPDLYKSPKYTITHICRTFDTFIWTKRTQMCTNNNLPSTVPNQSTFTQTRKNTGCGAQQWYTFVVRCHKWIFVDEEKNNVCNSITRPF